MSYATRTPIRRSMTTLLITVVAAATTIAGCERHVSGTANAEPPPHVFPDLDQYTAADPSAFYTPLRGGPSYRFITPTGVECRVTLGSMSCSGPFSVTAFGPDDDVCSTVIPTDQASADPPHTYTITALEKGCAPTATPPDHILDVGKKFELVSAPLTSFTCAVGPPERIACIDRVHDHGFVIEPTGSWTF